MTVMSRRHPFTAHFGVVVNAVDNQRLQDLEPRWVVSRLAEAGLVLFRGFNPDLESFSSFVRAHSSKVTLDPARSFHGGGVAQRVDAGTAAVGLHIENGNSPFSPDLTWFFCERAATVGSQTTVCDGYQVWDNASESARKQFSATDIVYSRRVDEGKWKGFVHYHLGGVKPLEEITIDDILALTNDRTSTAITANEDGSIIYSYRTAAAHPTLFGERLAWANSIFGPSYNYEKPRITFADGSEMPAELVSEMRVLTDALTENIDWFDGDVALIDNTRVMHGRRAIEDPHRTIYNAQSYLTRELI
jgi:alpha-ketoglutarate-dependent taurine dioxygenase